MYSPDPSTQTALPPLPTPIYHITHARNLPSILAQGGLVCVNALRRIGVGYTDIAHQHIQDRRASKLVPCGPGGVLHNYVPFYFSPRSPMLYSIHCGNVQGYAQGQEPIVHLVTSAQHVQELGLPFVFTDGHGTVAFTDYFDTLDDLARVDWAIMRSTYWRDTYEDSDRKRRRQAEFLVWPAMPWTGIIAIGVMNTRMRETVVALLDGAAYHPPGGRLS